LQHNIETIETVSITLRNVLKTFLQDCSNVKKKVRCDQQETLQ